MSKMSLDKVSERGNWTGKLDFILSCIGFAIGLGNIWRFPYICYTNGGGAFLIPYLFFMLTCGMPLVFLEFAFGQFANLSPITIWKISPFFKGIGYGMVLISAIVCIYYNIIMAWNFYYLFSSFTSKLPWSTCGNPWNSEQCVVRTYDNRSSTHSNLPSLGPNLDNTSHLAWQGSYNSSKTGFIMPVAATALSPISSSEEFWINHVLDLSPGIEYLGSLRKELFGCLVLAWVIIFLCLIKGVKSSGKIVYVSATLPYLILIILFFRGLMLPGAMDGVKLFFKPDWAALKDVKIWIAAATQIFYSQAAGWGGLITMASYNKFHHNCYRDAIILPFINSGTSIFAGIVVFSFIGFMAYQSHVPVQNVIKKGPGLAFVVYTEAVANMPLPYLWASLFFLMIFTVGIDSQFAMFETCLSAFTDEFPKYLGHRKVRFCAFLCTLLCLLGIPCVTQGGMYVLQLIDHYSASFSLMLISFLELFAIQYVYGSERFMVDIEIMIGRKPCRYWSFLWRYITPAIILVLLVFSILYYETISYNDEYYYPVWAIILGWMMAMVSLVPLPIMMGLAVYRAQGKTLYQKFVNSLKPTDDWGPAGKNEYDEYKERLVAMKSKREKVKELGKGKANEHVPLNRVVSVTPLPGDVNIALGKEAHNKF